MEYTRERTRICVGYAQSFRQSLYIKPLLRSRQAVPFMRAILPRTNCFNIPTFSEAMPAHAHNSLIQPTLYISTVKSLIETASARRMMHHKIDCHYCAARRIKSLPKARARARYKQEESSGIYKEISPTTCAHITER